MLASVPRDLPSLLPQQLQHQVEMYHDHIWKVVHNTSHHGFLEEKITTNKDDRLLGNFGRSLVKKLTYLSPFPPSFGFNTYELLSEDFPAPSAA